MEKELRSELAQVKLTPFEKRILTQLSDNEKMKVAEFLRLLVRQAAKNSDLWPVEDKHEKQTA